MYKGPIKRGERRGQLTEFKCGDAPANKLPIGAVTIRQHRGDHRRAWIKVAEPNEWMPRAVWVWIQNACPIPAGFVIHHLNEDTLDDRIENLALIIRAAHPQLHRDQFRQAQSGQVVPVKQLRCTRCGYKFNGKYQRGITLCDQCRLNGKREANRRYKERLRSRS